MPSEVGAPRVLPPGNVLVAPHPVAFVLAEAIAAVDALVAGRRGHGRDRPPRERARQGRARRAVRAGRRARRVPAGPEGASRRAGSVQRLGARGYGRVRAPRRRRRLGDPRAAAPPRPPLGARGRLPRTPPAARAAPRRGRAAARRAPRGVPARGTTLSTSSIPRTSRVPSSRRAATRRSSSAPSPRRGPSALTLAADHLRRGGAILAVRLAEELLRSGRLAGERRRKKRRVLRK